VNLKGGRGSESRRMGKAGRRLKSTKGGVKNICWSEITGGDRSGNNHHRKVIKHCAELGKVEFKRKKGVRCDMGRSSEKPEGMG